MFCFADQSVALDIQIDKEYIQHFSNIELEIYFWKQYFLVNQSQYIYI